ncbi:MAG: phosphohydrolase [Bacillota bacterium]
MANWIETYTGKKFYPLDPRPEDVCIEDIAHSLAMQCRFNGHTRVFYSVAEHSVLMARELALLGYGKTVQLYGLLHDAAEAYLCDLPRPIKQELNQYRTAEIKLQRTILNALGLSSPGIDAEAAITIMDSWLLGYEGRTLMSDRDAWTMLFGKFTPKSTVALGVAPATAKKLFLELFEELSRPECYTPEKDKPYPLCQGNVDEACKECCLFKDFTDGKWGF